MIPLCIPNVSPLRWLTRAHNNSLLYLLIFKIKETQTCVDENVTPYLSPNLKLEVHAKNKIYIYIYISSRIKDDASIICDSRLSARQTERLGAKLRVTENRCVLFNSLTYVYLAMLPQH